MQLSSVVCHRCDRSVIAVPLLEHAMDLAYLVAQVVLFEQEVRAIKDLPHDERAVKRSRRSALPVEDHIN